MLSETDREKIRRAFYLEKKSIRQLAKEEGRCRQTIRQALSSDPARLTPLARSSPAPVFGPYQHRVQALLRQNEQLPPKQRYTAHRIFEVSREEGYQGSESTVRHALASLKKAKDPPEVFVPRDARPWSGCASGLGRGLG